MHHRGPAPAHRDRTSGREEGGLTDVTFVGSFGSPDFVVAPPLPEVAMLGRSNVGKSSLLNALVERKAIARTSKTPGKTRDCNVYRLDNRGYLVDLPGYGYARVSKSERRRFGRLIEAYLSTREALVGVVWLLDLRHLPSADDVALGALLEEAEVPALVALTKADKLKRGHRVEQAKRILDVLRISREQAIVTSVVTGEGIADLRESILAVAEEAVRS